MSGFILNTDFTTIEPSEGGGRSYFPPSDSKGWLCAFEDDEEQVTNKGTANEGKMLNIIVKGLEGPVQGKLHTIGLNIVNQQYPRTVEIALSEMSAIAHVCGRVRIGNIQELKGIPFRLVIIEETGANARPGNTRHSKILTANGQTAKEALNGAGSGGGAAGGGAAAFGAAPTGGGAAPAGGAGGSTAFNPDQQNNGGAAGGAGGGFNGGGQTGGGFGGGAATPGWNK